jgi:UDP-GlcNAc3NAcA epimerase
MVSRAVSSRDGIEEVLVHTGQHYDGNMSDVFFVELEIHKPNWNLGIGSGSHGEQTGRMLQGIEKVLAKERPDWTLVYGDTNSTLAGALASVKLGIPVAHVEAGLRSYNQYQPEEINRVATDAVAQHMFPPTKGAEALLLAAGHAPETVTNVGDVMYDAALYYGAKADATSKVLARNDLQPGAYILATVHRAENTDSPERLRAVFDALAVVGADIPVVLPLHPRTRAALEAEGLLQAVMEHCRVIDPVGYLDMVALEKSAAKIVTDSGGVQKEAFFYGVPCITLRDETEWVELVDLGWNRLAPPESVKTLIEAIKEPFETPGRADALYGDGRAAEKIVTALVDTI